MYRFKRSEVVYLVKKIYPKIGKILNNILVFRKNIKVDFSRERSLLKILSDPFSFFHLDKQPFSVISLSFKSLENARARSIETRHYTRISVRRNERDKSINAISQEILSYYQKYIRSAFASSKVYESRTKRCLRKCKRTARMAGE